MNLDLKNYGWISTEMGRVKYKMHARQHYSCVKDLMLTVSEVSPLHNLVLYSSGFPSLLLKCSDCPCQPLHIHFLLCCHYMSIRCQRVTISRIPSSWSLLSVRALFFSPHQEHHLSKCFYGKRWVSPTPLPFPYAELVQHHRSVQCPS